MSELQEGDIITIKKDVTIISITPNKIIFAKCGEAVIKIEETDIDSFDIISQPSPEVLHSERNRIALEFAKSWLAFKSGLSVEQIINGGFKYADEFIKQAKV